MGGRGTINVTELGVVRVSVKTRVVFTWVDPWVGLGLVGLGQDFSVFVGLGWVHYSKGAKNLKGL